MEQKTDRSEFAPAHHALLFAWISRAVVRRIGEGRGEAVVRQAVRRYGEQRGRRMALRAATDGYPLTMDAYMAYGEWRAPEGTTAAEVVQEAPDPVQHVLECPWHRAWQDQSVMPYGRLYCLEVDHALARGFSPEIRLSVNSIKSGGDDCCEFVFHGATPEGAVEPNSPTVMPWQYHLGHLYKTMGQILVEELGELGKEALEEGLSEFAARYGPAAARAVEAYGDTDFDRLPEMRSHEDKDE